MFVIVELIYAAFVKNGNKLFDFVFDSSERLVDDQIR
jgi:hypothetical protein